MDARSTSVVVMTLTGLGASARLAASAMQREAKRSRAIFATVDVAPTTAEATPADPTHRDGTEGSSELLRPFRESGYVIVRDLFSREEMAEWKAMINQQLARWPQKSIDPSTGREVSAATTGVSVWMAKGEDPASPLACPSYFVDKMCRTPKLGRILHQLLGPDVEFLSTKPVLKTGRITHASPWHQDWPVRTAGLRAHTFQPPSLWLGSYCCPTSIGKGRTRSVSGSLLTMRPKLTAVSRSCL
jgi:hypothetical protein